MPALFFSLSLFVFILFFLGFTLGLVGKGGLHNFMHKISMSIFKYLSKHTSIERVALDVKYVDSVFKSLSNQMQYAIYANAKNKTAGK